MIAFFRIKITIGKKKTSAYDLMNHPFVRVLQHHHWGSTVLYMGEIVDLPLLSTKKSDHQIEISSKISFPLSIYIYIEWLIHEIWWITDGY
jgi:hypothetical protein